MTSRSKNAVRTYETEIEKSREEFNWKKAIELAQQLKARSPQHESLAHFLIGEGKLEAFLNEWPPTKENIERAQRELSEARGYLTLATDEAGKKAGVALDSHLLLGKLNYACGAYDDALKHYKMAELNTLTEKELPVRSLRIVAESYAIKGFCLEQTAVLGSSRYKQAERENETIRSFELASDLTLLYLQKTSSSKVAAGPTLESALLRVPLLHLQAGRLHSAVDRYREMLSAVEAPSTQSLRLTLTRQLAEVLMRGLTGQVYVAPEKLGLSTQHQGTLSRRREDYVSDGPWKPKRYASLNQFVPRTELEEVLLSLLVGEAMAVRDAVLSQSPEFEAARAHSYCNAAAVYDLLALAALRFGQLCLILESLERAMKFSFGERHVWRQRALATAAAAGTVGGGVGAAEGARGTGEGVAGGGEGGGAATAGAQGAQGGGVRAHQVLCHARTLAPDDAALRLVGANTCYNIHYIEEGIALAEEALDIEERLDGPLAARCHLYTAIGYQMKAQKTNSRIEKQASNDKCLKLLVKSVQLDDNDHLSLYYLALQYSYLGMLDEAMDATRACLGAHAGSAGGLRLLGALWGARGADGREQALSAAALACLHHPAAEWPRAARALLQVQGDRPEAALATGKELLSLSRGASASDEGPNYSSLDARSDSAHGPRDAASVVAESVGAPRLERALSEGASSMSGSAAVPAAPRVARAWLLLARLCLRADRVTAAWGCVAEAAALQPYSHLVIYTRGLVHAARLEWDEARQCFQNALALHPTHLDSMLNLGSALYELGWARLAESALRSAAALQPARADTWRRLALVLAALGDHHAAADCAAAAIELAHAPHAPPDWAL